MKISFEVDYLDKCYNLHKNDCGNCPFYREILPWEGACDLRQIKGKCTMKVEEVKK